MLEELPDEPARRLRCGGHVAWIRAGELSAEEERALFEAAARDQDLFDQLMEAETIRHALSVPEERRRAAAVLRAWEEPGAHAGNVEPVPIRQAASLRSVPPRWAPAPPAAARSQLGSGQTHRARALLVDVLRSVVSTVTTTLSLRLCYALITAVGSSLVIQQVQTGERAGASVPPVPSILHLVHAAIAALLFAIQFTPFLRPQASTERDHPIARSVSLSSSPGGAGRGPRGWRCTAGCG